jgi:hypothetical protein
MEVCRRIYSGEDGDGLGEDEYANYDEKAAEGGA